ncbi:MAG: 3D domain-containing protein [Pyrinomonadaceae bacterium]|nr:3D domain-containing protein [Pyrinomonadaceae bacterium]
MKNTVRNGASYFFVLAALFTTCITQTKSSAATNDLYDTSATTFAKLSNKGFVNSLDLTTDAATSTDSSKKTKTKKINPTGTTTTAADVPAGNVVSEKSVVSKEFASSSSFKSFTATAYCLKGRTAQGSGVRRGIIAADPRVLPLGTRVQISAGAWSGNYTVTDTGGAIKGRIVDIWVPNLSEARRFGRRAIKIAVLGKR